MSCSYEVAPFPARIPVAFPLLRCGSRFAERTTPISFINQLSANVLAHSESNAFYQRSCLSVQQIVQSSFFGVCVACLVQLCFNRDYK